MSYWISGPLAQASLSPPPVLGRLITTVPIAQFLVSWRPVGFSHREGRQQIQSVAREVKVFLSQPPSPSGVGILQTGSPVTTGPIRRHCPGSSSVWILQT